MKLCCMIYITIKIYPSDTSSAINIPGREGICIIRFRIIGDVLKIWTSIDNSFTTHEGSIS